MKFILIVFMSFHFEAGTAATHVEFTSEAACEAARAKVVQAHRQAIDGWGRARVVAVCAGVR